MSTPHPEIVPFYELPDAPQKRDGSVSDFVLNEIARRIVNAEYRPGQRIVESEVTRDLGVSRGSVREALRRLEINRFVVIEPNRGATVATPRREEIVAQFRIREVVSGLGARLAAERVNEPGHREITLQLLHDIEEQISADSQKAHRKENGRFHRAVNGMSGVPDVGNLLDQFNFPIIHTIYFRDLAHEHWTVNMSDHLDIARAILHGDGTAAEHFARRHMSRMIDIAAAVADGLERESRHRS